MDFRIADTFTDSLAKLTVNEQKAAKTSAFDLQLNPARLGLRFYKLDGARDPNFWSVRVSRDIRIIVHRTRSSLMLCYVGHHDDAYKWAERRKLETYPRTGAAQLIEVRQRIREQGGIVSFSDVKCTTLVATVANANIWPFPALLAPINAADENSVSRMTLKGTAR